MTMRIRRRGGAAWRATTFGAAFGAWLTFGPVACGDSTSGGNEGTSADPLAERAQAVPAVPLATFANDPREYEGTEVRLANAPVDSRLGQTSFWLKLPNQGLYLVRGTAESTASAQPGERVTVAGPVLPMTDSVVTTWLSEGAITADQEMEARYATSYIDAWYVSSEQAASAAQEG